MGKPVEKMSFICGEDLSIPHPNEVTEDFFYGDGYDVDANKKIEQVNFNIMKNGFKIIKELEYIELSKIINPSHDWLIFNRLNEDEKNELKQSILQNGLFSPVILWEWVNGKYMVLSGVERVGIYNELYEEVNEGKNEEYMKIPSFVLKCDEINDILARIIRIDSNICVRNMNIVSKNRAICEKAMALKKLKQFRNQFNVIDELSRSFNVSRSTITNHLLTEKVIEEFLYLFQEGVLSLKSIKKLAKFSREEQMKIITTLGLNNIKECQISVLNEKSIDNEKELNSSLNIIKDIKEPYFAYLKIKLPRKFVDDAVKLLEMLIKKNKYLMMKLRKPKLS